MCHACTMGYSTFATDILSNVKHSPGESLQGDGVLDKCLHWIGQ